MSSHLSPAPEALVHELRERALVLEASNAALRAELAERVRTEAALRESDAQFRLVVESMPQIVWIARPDGWHVHFNQQWMDFTGRTLAESLGHGWNPPFHPEDRPRAAVAWDRATATGEPYEIEYRLRRADGVYHWMLGRAAPLRDATGAIVKWFGTCTDIEDLKQAESRIGEQAQLLDQTQDSIVVQDLDHRVVYWNRGAERIHGWSAAEAIGQSLEHLVSPDLAQITAAAAVMVAEGEWSGDLRFVDRAGTEVIMEGRWSLLLNQDGSPRGALAVNTDVTERRATEARFLEALQTRATHDALTGLANRTLLFERLSLLLGQRQRAGIAVAFIDLDGFKIINDRLGHRTGDQLLVEVADRLRSTVRQGDLLARIGGDEFVVVGEAADEATALALGERLASSVRGPTGIGGPVVLVSASVGVAFVDAGEQADPDEVLHRADAVMYEVKRRTRSRAAREVELVASVD